MTIECYSPAAGDGRSCRGPVRYSRRRLARGFESLPAAPILATALLAGCATYGNTPPATFAREYEAARQSMPMTHGLSDFAFTVTTCEKLIERRRWNGSQPVCGMLISWPASEGRPAGGVIYMPPVPEDRCIGSGRPTGLAFAYSVIHEFAHSIGCKHDKRGRWLSPECTEYMRDAWDYYRARYCPESTP